MKKILSILLATIMLLGLVPAFAADAPVEVTILLEGNNVTDDSAVLEKLNAYLAEKINVTVKPIWGTWADFDDKAMNAINSGDKSVDMMFTCSWTANNYSVYANKGAFVRLDDPENDLIAKYGTDLIAALPEVLINAAKTEGPDGVGLYAVPGFKDIATTYSWDVNVTLLEKYGYTLEDIKSRDFYSFGDILETVKKGEGENFYPMYIEGAVLERMVNNAAIVAGDTNLLLSYYMDFEDVSKPNADYGLVLTNKYATPEYEKYIRQMREYYLAGYVHPSLAIGDLATDTWRNAQNNAEYLLATEVTVYGHEATTSAARGIEVAYVYTSKPYVDNTSAQGALIAISANSEHPEEAMKFLSILNADPYVMTLMNYGVEGIHYNLNDIGEVVFTDERANYTPWTNGLGNVTILPPQQNQGANFQEEFKKFYAEALSTPLLGFSFDPTPVKNEVAAVANIKEAYALTFNVGAVDVDEKLPEFLQKLEDAGMQKIVDEANAQFKAFLAE